MLPFLKMNGAGNDFVVLDARDKALALTVPQIRAIAARENHVTKGCDQLVIIEPDHFMRLYNADGSETDACGNATRCVAWLLMDELKKDTLTITTNAGKLQCQRAGELRVAVDMGVANLDPFAVAHAADVRFDGLPQPHFVSMGNPHAVFFVDGATQAKIGELGPRIENDSAFINRANVSFARIIGRHTIDLRVWERGTGLTLACGTAACATLVAAAKNNLTERKADIHMPGGTLTIEYKDDGRVMMTGPVMIDFEGTLDV